MRLKDLLGVSLEELRDAAHGRGGARGGAARSCAARTSTPQRRRELLAEALGHIDRQLELVRHRAAELARSESFETRKRVRRKSPRSAAAPRELERSGVAR